MTEIKFSLVIPIYKNELNIEPLYREILKLKETIDFKLFEVVLVVDGSPDRSDELILRHFSTGDLNFRLIRHSRNFGSFEAIRTGIRKSAGDYIAVMAADLQEPITLVSDFFTVLATEKYDIVVGTRSSREDSHSDRFFSQVFWRLFKALVNKEIPRNGVDVFGVNSKAKENLLGMKEVRTSLIGQLYWIGFRRLEISYKRKSRQIGVSAWSFSRKLEYLLDSIFSFTDIPVRLMLFSGIGGAALFLILGLVTLVAKMYGVIQVEGFTTLVILIVACQIINIFSFGILGAYIFRALENTRSRPYGAVQSEESFKLKN